MPPEIFASYSREDQAQVFPIVDKLRERGINIWIDQEGIHGAKLWSQEIVNAIEGSKVFILFASAKAFLSKNVTKELALASESDKHILPIFIEDAEIPAAMKYQLAGIQHLVHEQGQTEQTADNILRTLGNLDIQSGEPQPTVAATPPAATKPVSKTPLVATALVIALLALIYVFKPSTPTSEKPVAAEPEAKPLDKNRIVVLPFKNIGTAGENDHIVEGIVDDLNTMLSKVDGLKVIGSVSAKTYKGSDMSPSEIGQELNTGTLIQGSIQKAEEQLKINVKLIDVNSGEISWAESYSGNETDRFALQSQIVKSVGENLEGIVIDDAKIDDLKKGGTTNTEAYDLVQRAKVLLNQNTKVANKEAIDLLKNAVLKDPNYADAYVHLGYAYTQGSARSINPPDETHPKAKVAFKKSLELNPNNPEALAGLGDVAFFYERNLEEGRHLLRRAVINSPVKLETIWGYYFMLQIEGRYEEMVSIAQKGIELDPKSPMLHQLLAFAYSLKGEDELAEKANAKALSLSPTFQWGMHFRSMILTKSKKYDEAVEMLNRGIKDDPDNPVSTMSLGVVYWKQGKEKESLRLLAELLHRSQFEYIKSDIFSRFYVATGDYDKAIEWVLRSKKLNEPGFMGIHAHPWFKDIIKMKEYKQIYIDAGLYEEALEPLLKDD